LENIQIFTFDLLKECDRNVANFFIVDENAVIDLL